MSHRRTAVVVADSPAEGSRVFGRFFDDLRLGTFDALEELIESKPKVIALTGADLLIALDRIMAAAPSGLEELHLHPSNDLVDQVVQRLAASAEWALTDIARTPDGDPVLLVRPSTLQDSTGAPFAGSQVELTLSLSALRPYEVKAARWPAALALEPAPRPKKTSQSTGERTPSTSRGRRIVRARKPLLLAAASALGAAVAIVVLALLGGFHAVVIGLLCGIALMAATATVGLFYVVRLLQRLARQHDSVAEGLSREVAQLQSSVDNTLKRQRRTITHLRRIERAVPTITAKQAELQEYVAEFAGQVAEAEAAALERAGG